MVFGEMYDLGDQVQCDGRMRLLDVTVDARRQ